jgi:ABC-type amino acid transport substrate-binding protein
MWKVFKSLGLSVACLLSAFSLGLAPLTQKTRVYHVDATASALETVRVSLPSTGETEDDATFSFFKEYLQAIADYAKWNLEFISTTWAEGFTKVQSGDIDLLMDVSPTAERSAYLDFSEQNMGTEMCCLIGKS